MDNTTTTSPTVTPTAADQRAARLALPRWRTETFIVSQLARRAGLKDDQSVRAIDAGRSFWTQHASQMADGLEVAGVSRVKKTATTGDIRFRGGRVAAAEGWQLAVLRLASDVRIAAKTLAVPERGLLEHVLDHADMTTLMSALTAHYR